MSFNPDYTKPAHEFVFSCKRSETHHPLLIIINVSVKHVPFHKHLGLILDSKLDFNKHINFFFFLKKTFNILYDNTPF